MTHKELTNLLTCFTILLTLLSAVSFTYFVHAAGNNEQEGENHWLLFEVDQHDEVSLIASRPTKMTTSPCVPSLDGRFYQERALKGKIILTYNNNQNSNPLCHVVVRDPRITFHDHDGGEEKGKKSFAGGVQKEAVSQFAVVVHSSVEKLESVQFDFANKKNQEQENQEEKKSAGSRHHHLLNKDKKQKKSKIHSIPLEGEERARFQRRAEALASSIDSTQVVYKQHQMVGLTNTQRNMVFLSSGYTSAQQSVFDNDVQSMLSFLQQSSSTVSSMPYRRYFSTWNFFSVFHPSVDSGASHPAPAGSGATSDNILQCTYGSSSARILTCNRPKVLVLASYAPPDPTTSLTVVLVNDNTFGGTGGSGICSVYTGSKMQVVFIHEIGHAFAELSDEYSYETSETADLDLLNCHYSALRNVPWEPWIQAGEIGNPVRVCTYENYYKPTNGQCLMHSEQHDLCKVCRQATTLTMYGLNGTNAPDGINLASPRFPSEHDTIVIRENSVGYLKLNSHLPSHTDDSGIFSISWFKADKATLISVNTSKIAIANSSYTLPSSTGIDTFQHTGTGTYRVYALITDHTSMLLPYARANLSTNTSSRQSFSQMHEYKIEIITDAASSSCVSRTDVDGDTYCGICDSGYNAECTLNVSARPLAAVADVSGHIPGLDAWLIGIGCAFVGVGIIAFFFVWKTMEQHAEENVGEILPLTEELEHLRVAVMIVQVLQLLASTFVIMYAAYMFMVVSIFGRSMVLGIVVVTCCVWFASFFGFAGAYFNNRQVIFSSFVLAVFFLALTLLFTGMLLRTVNEVDNDLDIFLQLRSEWRQAVEFDPAAACSMQSYLYCSGFEASCVTSIGATSDCPVRCDVANQIAFPCWPKIQNFVTTHFHRAAIGGIINACFLFISMIMCIIFGCGMKINKSRVTRQRYKRACEGRNTLTDSELTMLRKEFAKVDRTGTGQITRADFAKFYSRTMGVKMSAEQLREYFDALDQDGSGTLSFQEFVKIYMPTAVDQKTLIHENQHHDHLQQSNNNNNNNNNNKGQSAALFQIHSAAQTPTEGEATGHMNRSIARMKDSTVSFSESDNLGVIVTEMDADDIHAEMRAKRNTRGRLGGRRHSSLNSSINNAPSSSAANVSPAASRSRNAVNANAAAAAAAGGEGGEGAPEGREHNRHHRNNNNNEVEMTPVNNNKRQNRRHQEEGDEEDEQISTQVHNKNESRRQQEQQREEQEHHHASQERVQPQQAEEEHHHHHHHHHHRDDNEQDEQEAEEEFDGPAEVEQPAEGRQQLLMDDQN